MNDEILKTRLVEKIFNDQVIKHSIKIPKPTWFQDLLGRPTSLTALISGLLTNQPANQVAVRHSVNWVMIPRKKRTKKFPQRCYKSMIQLYHPLPSKKITFGHLKKANVCLNIWKRKFYFWKANHLKLCLFSRRKLRFRTTMRLSRLEMMTVTFNCMSDTNLPGMFHVRKPSRHQGELG